ncbi:MAG: MgtC/SapB family protein [Archangium sp.]
MIDWELFLRIFVGAALGGIIGYERDVHGRPAGLRTHMLVGLASASFMVVSTHFVFLQHYAKDDLVSVDASRIAASIVTGMGFLAGGAILRNGITVQGLTTAAALWLVGAIGMASGAGMFAIATFVTTVGVLVLTMLRRFEDKDTRSLNHRRIDLALGAEASAATISTRLVELGLEVATLSHERKVDDGTQALTLDVRVPQQVSIEQLINELGVLPAVRRVRVDSLS